MTNISLVDRADHKKAIESAINCRTELIRHVEDSLRPGGKPLTVIDPVFPHLTETSLAARLRPVVEMALSFLPSAELVLWRGDLQQHAEAQAEQFAGTAIANTDLPDVAELWTPYGFNGMLHTYADDRRADETYARFFRLLMPNPEGSGKGSKARKLLNLGFCFRVGGSELRVNEPPRLALESPLVVGERPVSVGAQSLLSCLAFRQSTFVGEERGSIDRAARRRMERAGEPLPLVRIVNLRRKEREAQEHPHLSDSEYQYQWYVRPHVRQPNSRMKEQRPIWVNAYIKGPEGKPLKPPTMNVTVVKR